MFLRWHPHQRSTHQAEISTQFELGFLNWPEHHPNWDAAAVNLCKHESMSFFCVCLCVCVCVCVCVCIALACVFFRSSGWVRPLQLGRRVPFLRSPSCQRSMRKKMTKRRGWKKTFGQWHPPKARLFVSSRAFPLRKIPRIRFFFFVCVCVCVRVCSRPSSPHFLCGHFFLYSPARYSCCYHFHSALLLSTRFYYYLCFCERSGRDGGGGKWMNGTGITICS